MTERAWQPIHTAPRDGTWFLARTESGYERHVHFADARDRLPIDHKSGLWTTLPVEWCPDPAFQPPEAQPVEPDVLDQLRLTRDRLGKHGDLFMRLSGFYRVGPDGPAEPEFGYRDTRDNQLRQPIHTEAAAALADLATALTDPALVGALIRSRAALESAADALDSAELRETRKGRKGWNKAAADECRRALALIGATLANPAPPPADRALVEALRWYGATVAESGKLGVYGDQARQLLEQDGGKRAEAALATLKGSNDG